MYIQAMRIEASFLDTFYFNMDQSKFYHLSFGENNLIKTNVFKINISKSKRGEIDNKINNMRLDVQDR